MNWKDLLKKSTEVVEKGEHEGLKYKICFVDPDFKHQVGWYTAYVKVPFKARYDVVDPLVDVYGGLTYGVDDEGWIGIDFNHLEPVGLNKARKEAFVLAWQMKQLIDFLKEVRYDE